MARGKGSVLSKQSSTHLGASKGVNFSKSITDRKQLKFNIDSLKSLGKVAEGLTKPQKGGEEYFSRKGRLTSSNVPWTSRSPYTPKGDVGEEPDPALKFSDLGTGKKDRNMRMDPMQYIKDKSLKEKYRMEQIEQWKRENGLRKGKGAPRKGEGGLANSYSSKDGLSQLYQKHKAKAKGGPPGSFSGAPMNLKNFSSNTQMYNYGTAGYNNLNFSKNKFNMKQRVTNFMAHSKAEKFYNTSRGYLRSNEHLMPEINKKKSQLLKELRSKKGRDEPKPELFNSKSKEALKKNLNLKYLNRYKHFEAQTKTDRKVDYGKGGEKAKFKGSFKFGQPPGLAGSGVALKNSNQMLNNIYKKKGLRSPGKYKSNTFLESLTKGKKLDGPGRKKKNFLVDSGGNDQLSPHMFNYGGRAIFGQSPTHKDNQPDRSEALFRERGSKNFTQEQFLSHNPGRKAGLSLNRSKHASPVIPSLNKNFMGEPDPSRGQMGANSRGFHLKHPSQNKLSHFDLKLQKKNMFFHPDNDGQFLSSRVPRGEGPKRGALFDKSEMQRFKKGNTLVGSFDMKGSQKNSNLGKNI